MLRHLGRPAARTALVVMATGLGLPLLCSLPASSTPLDPGLYLFHGVFDGPLCSAPAALPGRPAWSEVTCRVGGDEFFVPAGVTVLQVDVLGAAGGAGAQGAAGGGGAEIRASIMVSPGEMLEMAVGGVGGNGNEMGGFNGGGDGPHAFPAPPSPSPDLSGGGGGSSDVRVGETGVWDRIISAAGGGGGGGGEAGGRGGASSSPGQAGAAGGAGGLPATSAGNGAGGGTGPTAGSAGDATTLSGGTGGEGQISAGAPGGDGGGGGSGYGFGGGGAGGAGATGGGGGGGGGSDFVNPQFLSPGVPVGHADGVNHGDGQIVVVYHAPPVFCGAVIYADTTLHHDLDCRGQPGITIGGLLNPGVEAPDSPVTFNLDGHRILGDGSTSALVVDRDDVTIEDGTLKGFGTGVTFTLLAGFTSGVASDPTISDMTFADGAAGVSGMGPANITNDRFLRMSASAILLSGPGDFGQDTATVTGNTITGSGEGVVVAGAAAAISGNVIRGSAGPAVNAYSTPSLTIDNNTLSGNQTGVSVDTDTSYPCGAATCFMAPPNVVIEGNSVDANTGVGVVWTGTGGPGNEVSGNVANRNGTAGAASASGDGIDIDLTFQAGDVSVANNRADNNLGTGIDAAGVIDGGGNLASGNRGAAQCVGVVCAPG